MAKRIAQTKGTLKDQMWHRLSVSPRILNLDARGDEEPEDLFVRLANSGQRQQVIRALKANLCDTITNPEAKDKQSALRFMRRALRLCDVIGAHECKPDLKYILLHEAVGTWGQDLSHLQELAARALDGMPKEPAEFEFWNHLIQKRDAILPYALNAIIEIDLDRGLETFSKIYVECAKTKQQELVEWGLVIQNAVDMHGAEAVSAALDHVFPGNPLAIEHFVHLSGIQELSRLGKRSVEEIASYAQQRAIGGREPRSDVSSQAPLPEYVPLPAGVSRREDQPTEHPLTKSYGHLTPNTPQTIVLDERAYDWRFYPPRKAAILPS
jgi:hypothetical protein